MPNNYMLVNDERIDKTSQVKYLGVFLDENVTLKDQIKSNCKTAMWNLQQIKSVRNTVFYFNKGSIRNVGEQPIQLV